MQNLFRHTKIITSANHLRYTKFWFLHNTKCKGVLMIFLHHSSLLKKTKPVSSLLSKTLQRDQQKQRVCSSERPNEFFCQIIIFINISSTPSRIHWWNAKPIILLFCCCPRSTNRRSYILCHTLLCHTPLFCLFCQKIAPTFCVIHEVTYSVIHFFTVIFCVIHQPNSHIFCHTSWCYCIAYRCH